MEVKVSALNFALKLEAHSVTPFVVPHMGLSVIFSGTHCLKSLAS